MEPRTYEGYQLLHQGAEALADVEQNGIMIDVDYVERQRKSLGRKITYATENIMDFDEAMRWKKKYGQKFNLGSDDQMADILYNELGYKPKIFTDSGKPSVSQEGLEVLDTPFIHEMVNIKRMKKTSGTFLDGILRETVDGILHPFFHLHIARTFRGSSSNVNFQNQPKRDKLMKRAIRRAMKPRPGHVIAELDYSGVEVTTSTFYHKDPTMIQDIIDPKKDMHRDMGMKCYLLDEHEHTRETRQAAKNCFVFPQFYGSWYKECAVNLWFAIIKEDLKTAQGVPLRKHLAKHGITSEAKFQDHIQSVEDYFWKERYAKYGQWKKDHWNEYMKNGYVDLLTGFRCSDVMSKNDCGNYPVQGAAFHCLLWSLIQINNWLKATGKRSLIIGQIHDSIVMDIHQDEINEVLEYAKYVMEEKISQHWKWIIVPFKVEMELTPVDGTWYDLDEVKFSPCVCGNNYRWVSKTARSVKSKCPICGKATHRV